MNMPMQPEEPYTRAPDVVVLFSVALVMLSALAVLVAAFGTHWGWWPFGTGFSVLKWGVYGAIAGLLASLISLFRSRGRWRGLALIGFMIALVAVLIPLSYLRLAREVPPIHDITTDMKNPPNFVAILPLRKNAANSAEYGGREVALQQAKAYPHIKPLILNLSTEQAFQAALSAAREMGWAIIAESPLEGRIEAVATTRWFGFKDDIVIRITQAGEASRVDVRSVSRVGKSDLGTNAKRIAAFLTKLHAASKQQLS